MRYSHCTKLFALIGELQKKALQKEALDVNTLFKEIKAIAKEPEPYFLLAQASHRTRDHTRTQHSYSRRNINSFEYVADFDKSSYLKYFCQETKANEAQVLTPWTPSAEAQFKHPAIAKFLNTRDPRTQRNLWESLCALNNPFVNDFIVANSSHIDTDASNGLGDIYSSAYYYKNYDLLEQLAKAQKTPIDSHLGKKNALRTILKENNLKAFSLIFPTLKNKSSVSDIVLPLIYQHNNIDIYRYLERTDFDWLLEQTQKHSRLATLPVAPALDPQPPQKERALPLTVLGGHKNLTIFKHILATPEFTFEFKESPLSFDYLVRGYLSHQLISNNTNFEAFFSRFELNSLGVRSVLWRNLNAFTKSSLSSNNKDFFNQLHHTFLKQLNQTIYPESAQWVIGSKSMLTSVAQGLLFDTEFTRFMPEFFENPELQFFHTSQEYQSVLSAQTQEDYQDKLEQSSPEVIEFFQNNFTTKEKPRFQIVVAPQFNYTNPQNWTFVFKDSISLHAPVSHEAYLELSDHDKTDKKYLKDKYTTVAAIIEKNKLQTLIEPLVSTGTKKQFKV